MSFPAQAETLIKDTGARVPSTRVRVLAFLLKQSRSYSHHELQRQLERKEPIDSVTLYRVLDWLIENGLAHKVAGDDQAWRFSAVGSHTEDHAHFQCSKCSTVTCFTDIHLPKNLALPSGFTKQEVNFFIRGVCPRCK